MRCWCGSENTAAFSPTYLVCRACGTLLSKHAPPSDLTQVTSDEQGFYGKEYWFSHQETALGHPNITVRARTDLPERCVHWLRATLAHRLPPGKALEIGSGSGAFVALLRWAGFDATGLELSPWVVNFSRQSFEIPVLYGPIEDQDVAPGSLDVIAALDVIEHLPDPVGTMECCLRLLKPDGVLIIQTPCRPEEVTYKQLKKDKHPFLEMLKPEEHLQLFSRSSIRQFFRRLGADHLTFEPPAFPHYDMFLFASRRPIVTFASTEIDAQLSSRPPGRMAQALLETQRRFVELLERYNESEADRAARLEGLRTLEKRLAESEADRAARLEHLHSLERLLAEAEVDRNARLDRLRQLEVRLAESEADRAERERRLGEAESALAQAEAEQARRLAETRALEKRLTESEAELRSRAREADQRRMVERRLRADLELAVSGLRAVASSRIYRLIRRLGRWASLADLIDQLNALPADSAVGTSDQRAQQLRRVAVDLTPVLPGGENGGAKPLAVGLISRLAELARQTEWTVLTSEKNHSELSVLDAPNVRRVCVSSEGNGTSSLSSRPNGIKAGLVSRLFSPRRFDQSESAARRLLGGWKHNKVVRRPKPQVLFCPFTAPRLFDPTVPTVSLVHDLQFLYYPQFFSAQERDSRGKNFTDAARLANVIVCVSEYVRQTVLENADVDPARVVTIPSRLFRRLQRVKTEQAEITLARYGLESGRYLLYPANFWEHKNHRMLLVAFGIYRERHSDSRLKLVFTGAPGPMQARIEEAVARSGLSEFVRFPGFIADREFSALLQHCQALIFPSLYEGFGLPVLEAMAQGRPVLCSNVTSLPEVAGNAALFFDPRNPREIAAAIERVTTDPALVERLIQAGNQRVAELGDTNQMAEAYLRVLRAALLGPRFGEPAVHGVFVDGWIGENLTVSFGGSGDPTEVRLELLAPDWAPCKSVSVREIQEKKTRLVARLLPGKPQTLQFRIASGARPLELAFDPTFRPIDHGVNQDNRRLSCLCQSCRLIDQGGAEHLLYEGGK